MSYPKQPTVFPNYYYQEEWFDRDFMHSPDGIKEFPDHHCKMSWLLSKPYVTKTRNAIDIGCRDGEYARYLQKYFNHTYCFDKKLKKRFPYNVPEGKTTHFHCALGKDYKLDDFNIKDVDYIKLDVDGAEWDILQGALKTIYEYRPIFCLEVEREPQERTLKYLVDNLNYEVKHIDARNMDRILIQKER
tara:strand:+ start:28 stop:594 length:567 start_codon:yes stop_codon:yes gene_type:complete